MLSTFFTKARYTETMFDKHNFYLLVEKEPFVPAKVCKTNSTEKLFNIVFSNYFIIRYINHCVFAGQASTGFCYVHLLKLLLYTLLLCGKSAIQIKPGLHVVK